MLYNVDDFEKEEKKKAVAAEISDLESKLASFRHVQVCSSFSGLAQLLLCQYLSFCTSKQVLL